VPSSSSSSSCAMQPNLNDHRPCRRPRNLHQPDHTTNMTTCQTNSRRFDYLWHLHIAAPNECPQRAPPVSQSSGYATIPRLLFKSYAHPTKAQRRQQDVGHLRNMQGEHGIRLAAILTTILYRSIPSWMDTVVDVKSTSGHLSLCLAAWQKVTSSGQDRADMVIQRPNWPGLSKTGRLHGSGSAQDAPKLPLSSQ
jgi:hypothetical protein